MMHFGIYKTNGNSSFISRETGALRDYKDLVVGITSKVVFYLYHKHTHMRTYIHTQSHKYIHKHTYGHRHTRSHIEIPMVTHVHIHTLAYIHTLAHIHIQLQA